MCWNLLFIKVTLCVCLGIVIFQSEGLFELLPTHIAHILTFFLDVLQVFFGLATMNLLNVLVQVKLG